ncbi:MAG: TatD family hydrolase [Candidatus Nomurabacteria bacterium]|jgi:TatD DNase family protein|nr:TatD family hydrolase [Candidatus Nomurabacteria bacterium]
MKLIDAHCHIHSSEYDFDPLELLANARRVGVNTVVCVGTSVGDSLDAIKFADQNDGVFALIGVHPHGESDVDNSDSLAYDEEVYSALRKMLEENSGKIVGLGDIGLDYHYKPFNRAAQMELFRRQLKLAAEFDLPVSFHVREAFADFWRIYDEFKVRGVLHSFTGTPEEMKEALKRGLYIGVNGIVTFNKEPKLAQVFATVPLDRIVLETDAPYLAPAPYRGQQNQPAYIKEIAEFMADLRGVPMADFAKITTENTRKLFSL